jgi:hypothetical protein
MSKDFSKKSLASAPVAPASAPVADATAPVADAAVADATAPVADAAVADATAPVADAAAPVEKLSRSIKEREDALAKANNALVSAINEGQPVLGLAAECDTILRQIADLKSALNAEKAVPLVMSALSSLALPEGRFYFVILAEGGKVVSVSRQQISGLTEAKAAVNSHVRANLNVANVDPRNAPEGWQFVKTVKGVPWTVTSLGQGRYKATHGDRTIEGPGNTVLSQLKGTSANLYFELGLGVPGQTFDPSNPPKGWTPPKS